MTLKDFIQSMIAELKKLLPINASIKHHLVEKNNGINMDAILICLPGHNIAPTLYVNDYYKDYLDGMEVSVLARDLVRRFYLNLPLENYDLSCFKDYDNIKGQIHYMIVQYSTNIDRLSQLAYIKYLDLAIIFKCDIAIEDGYGSIYITHSHLEMWDISLEALKKQAFENTPISNPAEITPLIDLLKKLSPDRFPDDFDESILDFDYPIYVLTNKSGCDGAACMLYPNILENFSNLLSDDIYIIPSSIHEVMLLPINSFADYDLSWFKDLISTVNHTSIPCVDVLSDNLYIYTRSDHELSIAV